MKRRWLTGAGAVAALSSVILFLLIVDRDITPTELKAQALSPSQDHTINLSDASLYTANFRSSAPAGAILGEFFGRDAIKEVLGQNDCIGIRMYYGKKPDGTPAIIIVGVNSKGMDMTDGIINERGYPCPPICDASSPLGH